MALEQDRLPPDAPNPLFTTISWRMAHLSTWLAIRAGWRIGMKELGIDDIEMPSSAATGIAALERRTEFWREFSTTVAGEGRGIGE